MSMKVAYCIAPLTENSQIQVGEVVEYDGKLWLVAPSSEQQSIKAEGPVRLIRLDNLPTFAENTPAHYILKAPLPKPVLFGHPGPKTTIEYEIISLQDISVCIRDRRFLN